MGLGSYGFRVPVMGTIGFYRRGFLKDLGLFYWPGAAMAKVLRDWIG